MNGLNIIKVEPNNKVNLYNTLSAILGFTVVYIFTTDNDKNVIDNICVNTDNTSCGILIISKNIQIKAVKNLPAIKKFSA